VTWLDHQLPATDKELYSALESTPFANELEEQFAERALETERLGQGDGADLLAVSFSAHDYVGHRYGPYSPEEHAVSLVTDKLLDKFFQLLDRRVGMANVLVILTADHGVAPAPGSYAVRKMPGGRIAPSAVTDAVQAALTKKYGEGSWIAVSSDLEMYLHLDLATKAGVDPAQVRREAARAVAALPHIFRVYTRDQLLTGQFLHDEVGQYVMNGYNEARGADIEFLPDPYWIISGPTGTTHGTPFGYDNHVPVIFLGTGIRAGRYDASVAVNDVAPTLATILDVEIPSGSVGRVLAEMFE
jgi:arylsulfatase A-like enzyme